MLIPPLIFELLSSSFASVSPMALRRSVIDLNRDLSSLIFDMNGVRREGRLERRDVAEAVLLALATGRVTAAGNTGSSSGTLAVVPSDGKITVGVGEGRGTLVEAWPELAPWDPSSKDCFDRVLIWAGRRAPDRVRVRSPVAETWARAVLLRPLATSVCDSNAHDRAREVNP